jgi:hypoxanthine phosphoribosyltransferase
MITRQIHDKKFTPFLTAQQLETRIEALGARISEDYNSRRPLLLVLLNGAFMFAAELVKHINIDCEIQFIKLASYHGTQSSGEVQTLIGLSQSLGGRAVIIVEDIVDTGITLQRLIPELWAQQPQSVAVCTLLHKPEALTVPLSLDYVGFEIPNNFVVGYGLDYDGLGRNLPEIYHLIEEK